MFSRDPDWSGRLLSEVEQPIWSEPPPPPLVQSLRKVDAQIKADRAREALEDVEARLDEALNARDPIRGLIARRDLARLSPSAAMAPDDPIADQAPPMAAGRATTRGGKKLRSSGDPSPSTVLINCRRAAI